MLFFYSSYYTCIVFLSFEPRSRNFSWIRTCEWGTCTNCFNIFFSFRAGNCFLAPDGGDCENRLSIRVKFFYDSANDDCKEFLYFGCGGNGNRFDTFEECESVCMYYNEYWDEPRQIRSSIQAAIYRLTHVSMFIFFSDFFFFFSSMKTVLGTFFLYAPYHNNIRNRLQFTIIRFNTVLIIIVSPYTRRQLSRESPKEFPSSRKSYESLVISLFKRQQHKRIVVRQYFEKRII